MSSRRAIAMMALLMATWGCTQSEDLVRSRAIKKQVAARGVSNETILAALRSVPRERFLPRELEPEAYKDGPIVVNAEQGVIVPSPFLVGLTLSLARLQGDYRVLEIGTGSGYQTAVISKLVARVHTMERHPDVLAAAVERFNSLGLANVDGRAGESMGGMPDAAPFDVVIMWVAPSYVPPMILNQVTPGGRLLMLTGTLDDVKNIRVIERNRDRTTNERAVIPSAR